MLEPYYIGSIWKMINLITHHNKQNFTISYIKNRIL